MLISVWVFSPWPIEKLSVVAGGLQRRGTVETVEVGRGAREDRVDLVLEVDSALIPEPHEDPILNDGVESETEP